MSRRNSVLKNKKNRPLTLKVEKIKKSDEKALTPKGEKGTHNLMDIICEDLDMEETKNSNVRHTVALTKVVSLMES